MGAMSADPPDDCVFALLSWCNPQVRKAIIDYPPLQGAVNDVLALHQLPDPWWANGAIILYPYKDDVTNLMKIDFPPNVIIFRHIHVNTIKEALLSLPANERPHLLM